MQEVLHTHPASAPFEVGDLLVSVPEAQGLYVSSTMILILLPTNLAGIVLPRLPKLTPLGQPASNHAMHTSSTAAAQVPFTLVHAPIKSSASIMPLGFFSLPWGAPPSNGVLSTFCALWLFLAGS